MYCNVWASTDPQRHILNLQSGNSNGILWKNLWSHHGDSLIFLTIFYACYCFSVLTFPDPSCPEGVPLISPSLNIQYLQSFDRLSMGPHILNVLVLARLPAPFSAWLSLTPTCCWPCFWTPTKLPFYPTCPASVSWFGFSEHLQDLSVQFFSIWTILYNLKPQVKSNKKMGHLQAHTRVWEWSFHTG